jgi:hypothetical protein
MTVVDKISPEEREAIKKEVRDEVHAEMAHDRKRRLLRRLGCFFLAFFFLIIAPILVGAIIVAKSGILEVPVISSAVYQPIAPTRTVQPLTGSSADDVMKTIAASAKAGVATGSAVLTITEQQLTTIVAAGITQGTDTGLPFAISSAQVAILDGQMEFFLDAVQNGRQVPVLIRVEPTVSAGSLHFSVKEATMGSLPLPAFMVEAALQKLADSTLSQATGDKSMGTLTGLKMKTGKLEMTFSR